MNRLYPEKQGPEAARAYRFSFSAPFLTLCMCCFLTAFSAGALDFGLTLNQELELSNERGDGEGGGSGAFFYTPLLGPWVQGFLGESLSFSISGKAGLEYANFFGGDSAWRDPPILPELDRSELTWLVSPALYFKLGRQTFQDPAGMAASGLFDGVSAGVSAGGSRFSGGLYYTGLLYKQRANIIMTGGDRREYGKPLSLAGDYFASRRILAAFEWENPGLSPASSLAVGILGQFDVNGEDDRLHSQYLSARYGLRLPGGPALEGTAAFGIGETGGGDGEVFFSGALGGTWMPPGAPEDQLILRFLFSSPSISGALGSFIPINSLAWGNVFTPAIGGISFLRGAYTLRPHQTVSLAMECSYFIRTDTVSFQDNHAPDTLKGEGYFLGGEWYGSALWSPLPDLTLNFGGGAFFPGLGNAFTDEADIRWKLVLGIMLLL
jgi:hypothetical protein